MNLRLCIAGGLFALSEVLPFLPVRYNGVLHATLSALHFAKLIPDLDFQRMERKARADIDGDGVIGTERTEDEQTTITILINRKKI